MVVVVRWWIKNSRRGGVLKCGVWVRTDEFCAIPLLVVSDFRVSYVSGVVEAAKETAADGNDLRAEGKVAGY